MAKGYNLTVQLNLQGPSNVNSVVNNLKRQLSGINANVNVQLPNNAIRQIAQVNKSLKQTARDANVAASGMEKFGKAAGLAVKRFGAFTAATAGFYAITRATQQSLQKFVEFDKQITRIAQVTNSTKQSLSGLSSEITKLSVSLGASSSELAAVSVTLSQAGLSARETEKALKALALTTLAPTFNNLNQTVEGSIALMKQFSISTGQLEKALGSINAVAGSFAVEAGDLITAVQRAGGVFAAASTGVSTGTQALNEFLAVFTSVRATTRESAETIATGLRTIFTRLQRADTIAALEAFGVTLTDLEGKFVGPYRAIEQLAKGLGRLDPRSLQFSGIVEELGGFRQVGKVIPLIQRFTTAQQALNVAQAGSGSLAKDAAIGQQALSVQVAKVAEEFNALIRSIGQTGEFRAFIRLSLDLASALIKIADAIKPVIPALAALGAAKLVGGLGQIGRGFRKGIGFNSGGLVPGSGNTDSVSANLTPGEYVIRKKAVQAIGVGNLERMNRYAKGGPVSPDSMGSAEIRSRIVRTGKAEQYAAGQRINAGDRINLDIQSIAFDGGKVGNTQFEQRVAASLKGQWFGGNAPVDVVAPGYGPVEVRNRSKVTPPAELADKLARYKLSTIGEAALSNQIQNDNINLGRIYVAYNTGKLPKEELEKKKLAGKKIRGLDRLPKNAKKAGYDFRPQPIKRKASGGPISGKDTVPALLTPGEYVLNERAASMLGEKTLNELNNADKIYGYNSGGPVRLFGGGRPSDPAWKRGFSIGPGSSGGGGDAGIGRTVGALLALQGVVAGLETAIKNTSATTMAVNGSLQGLASGAANGILAFELISQLPGKLNKLAKPVGFVVAGYTALNGVIKSVANSHKNFETNLAKTTLSKSLEDASKSLGEYTQSVNAASAANYRASIARGVGAIETKSGLDRQRTYSLPQMFSDLGGFLGNKVATLSGLQTSEEEMAARRGLSERQYAEDRVRNREGFFGLLSAAYDPSAFEQRVQAEKNAINEEARAGYESLSEQILSKAKFDVGRGATLSQVERKLTAEEKKAIALDDADVARRVEQAGGADSAAGQKIINQEVRKQLQISLGPALTNRIAASTASSISVLQVQLSSIFDSMSQAFKAVTASIDSDFAKITGALSASLGQTKIGFDNTARKNILENPKAFSQDLVERTISNTSAVLGNQSGRVSSLAIAGNRIEGDVSGIMNAVLSSGAAQPLKVIGAEIQNLISSYNLGSDTERVINSQLKQAFDKAVADLGPNATDDEIRQRVLEIVKIPGLEGAKEAVLGAFNVVSGAQQNYASVVQQVTDALLSQKEYIDRAAGIRREGDLELRKALGEDISLNDVIRNVGAAVAQQTGGTTSIARMSQNIQTLLARRSQIEARRSQLGGSAVDTPEWKALTDELSKLDIELANSRAGLELLANSTEIASAALNRISEIQARAQEKAGFAEKLATASPEEFLGMRRDYAALENILQGGQLTLQNSYDAQAAMMQAFAQGGTAGDIMAAGGQGLSQQKGSVLNLLKELKPFFGDNNKQFNKAYETVLRSFLKDRGVMGPAIEKMFAEMAGKDNETRKATAVYQQAIDIQARANEALAAIPQPVQALTQATNTLNNTIASLPQRINAMIPAGVAAPPAAAPARGRGGRRPAMRSSGGIIYANDGQYVEMKPRGTDTIPAMLTAGEFVVNRKATKKNRALLETINNGGTPSMMGGVAYANAGGYFGSYADSPAYQQSREDRYAMVWRMYKQAYGGAVPLAIRGALKRGIIVDDNRFRYWQEYRDKGFETPAGPALSAQQQAVYKALQERGASASVLANVRRDPRRLNAAAKNFGVDPGTGEKIERESTEDRNKRIRDANAKRRKDAEAQRSPGERTVVPAGPATDGLPNEDQIFKRWMNSEEYNKYPLGSAGYRMEYDNFKQNIIDENRSKRLAREATEAKVKRDAAEAEAERKRTKERDQYLADKKAKSDARMKPYEDARKKVLIDEYKELYTQSLLAPSYYTDGVGFLSEEDKARFLELNARSGPDSLQAMGIDIQELQKEVKLQDWYQNWDNIWPNKDLEKFPLPIQKMATEFSAIAGDPQQNEARQQRLWDAEAKQNHRIYERQFPAGQAEAARKKEEEKARIREQLDAKIAAQMAEQRRLDVLARQAGERGGTAFDLKYHRTKLELDAGIAGFFRGLGGFGPKADTVGKVIGQTGGQPSSPVSGDPTPEDFKALELIREKIAAKGGTGPGTRARRRSKPGVRSRQENFDALSAFGVGVAENILPTLVAAGAVGLAPFSGGTSLGALGLLGIGVTAGAATSYVQDAALQNVAPELYEGKEQIKELNPGAAFMGGLADPTLARGLFKPGKLARLFAEEAAQREAASAARLAQQKALYREMVTLGVPPDVADDAIRSTLMTGDEGFIKDAINRARKISTRETRIPALPKGPSTTVGQPYGPPGLPTPTKLPAKAPKTPKTLPRPAEIPAEQWERMTPEFQQRFLERSKSTKPKATQPRGLQIRGVQGNETIPATSSAAELREFYRRTGQTVNYMNSGGLARGQDQYPAMLSRGEMVMNPEATRRNKGLLRALNKSRGGMVKNGIVYANNGTDGGLGVTAGNGELRITGDVRVIPENIPEPTAISAGAPMAAPVGPAADTGGMEQMGSVLQEAFNSFGQNVSNIASPLTAFAGGAENLQNVFTVFNDAVTLMSSVNFGVISEGAQALQIAGNALSIASSSFVAPINGFRDSIASFSDQTNRLITAIATMGQVNGTINVVGSISLQPLQVDVVGVDGLVEAISGPITNAVLAQVGNALSAGNPGINVDGLNVGSIV